MSFQDKLRLIEVRLQRLFETSAARLLSSPNLTGMLVNNLVETMGKDLKYEEERVLAPNHFVVHLPPAAARELQGNPALLATLALAIEETGREAGLTFPSTPNITILEDQDLPTGGIKTTARTILGQLESTRNLDPGVVEEAVSLPPNAFLIINGNQVFPLAQPVINAGRRLDNHLVIDDPSVSRIHAQLRAIEGHFVIFDLDSTGGTFVNGQPVSRTVLYPGDVISLANVQMVYGQDAPRPLDESLEYTKPLPVDQKKTLVNRNRREADPKDKSSPASE